MSDHTCIGMDLASGRETAVLGVLRDGVWSFRELDLDNPEAFAGLKIDAVWVEEADFAAARALSEAPTDGVMRG